MSRLRHFEAGSQRKEPDITDDADRSCYAHSNFEGEGPVRELVRVWQQCGELVRPESAKQKGSPDDNVQKRQPNCLGACCSFSHLKSPCDA